MWRPQNICDHKICMWPQNIYDHKIYVKTIKYMWRPQNICEYHKMTIYMSHCHINLASHSSPFQSLLLKDSKRTHTHSTLCWFFCITRTLFGGFFVRFFCLEVRRIFFACETCVWRCMLQLSGGCAGLMVGKEKTHLTTLKCKSISLFHLNTNFCWCCADSK